MQAGESLFATNGYTHTSMAQIAAGAGVAVGSVYRLFPDKPALLAELHKAMEQRFIDAMLGAWSLEDGTQNPFGPMVDALLDEAEAARETMPLYALTKEVLGSANYAPGQTIRRAIADMYADGRQYGRFVDMDPGRPRRNRAWDGRRRHAGLDGKSDQETQEGGCSSTDGSDGPGPF